MPARSIAAAATVLVLALPAVAQDLSAGRWVDLTHAFNEDSVYWPTAETFELEEVFHGHTEGGWFYTAYNFSAAEHGGTHLDAPIHFAEGAPTADADPGRPDDRPGRSSSTSARSRRRRRLPGRRRRHRGLRGRARPDPRGRDRPHRHRPRWALPRPRRLHGHRRARRGGGRQAALPGLGTDGAELLAARGIGAVGIDTPSIDHGQSKDFATHVALMTSGIPAFENVADMSELPPTGATIVALPMKIEGGSGGPLRIVAHLPE